ncbi:NUDIX hydrolase domain-like protein [Nemania sp. NC0429]|nr:NUDIX hydrolase domain-like protein [Nemania sp. NC0429]
MSTTQPVVPRVGVAVIIVNRQGELLMGRRLGSHGAGSWAFPGGHLEMGESFEDCAARETLEETGLRVRATNIVAVTNDVFNANSKHYITIFVQCIMEDLDAKPETLEPNKCEGWHWVSWETVLQWCQRHDDPSAEWADKRCFLPLRNLANDKPELLPLLSSS